MLKKILKIIAISGIFLFVYYFIKQGPENIWLRIRELSIINFLILLGLRFLYWSIRSLNWQLILKSLGEEPRFFRVFSARMGSHSVGYLTPTAKIGGEVIRIFLFEDMDKKKVTASVIIDKMIELFASIIIVCSGVVVSLLILDLNSWIKNILSVLTIMSIGVLAFFFRKQKDGFFMWFRKKIRVGEKYFSSRESDIKVTDEFISGFYKKHRGKFLLVMSGYFLNYIVWILEIYLTLFFLGSVNITVLKSFLITTLGSFAFIFPLLPGSLGMFEMTYLGLFKLLEIVPAIGLGYLIVRRILGLLLAGAGLFPVFRSGFRSGRT